MSASSKKKLRKEQEATLLTERQQKEQAEARKLKRNTILFISVIAVVVVIALVSLISGFITRSGVYEKNTIAAQVDGNDINSVEMSYYYYDTISNTYSQWKTSYGDYLSFYLQMMGLDITKSLDDQTFNAESGQSWADYFVDLSLETIQSDFALNNQAAEEGFTLSETDQASLDSALGMVEIYASTYGYSSANDYLTAVYGYGADMDSYTTYKTRNAIANAYYTYKYQSMEYTSEDIEAYLNEHPLDFTAFDYNAYYLNINNYLTGKDEYTDEERAEAAESARKNALGLSIHHNTEDLDTSIAALYINKDNSSAKSTAYTNTMYTSVNEVYRDWLADEERQEGDITSIPYEVTTTDEDGKETTTLQGYFVVLFHSRNDNAEPMGNVRHLLVKFEGGTTENDVTTYTDEEKAATLAKAEEILAQWQAGVEAGEDAEESFIALVKEKSEDTGSIETGGLYEDLHVGLSYEANFLNWAIDPQREAGETGIVETSYGYHIMYYVGDDEMSYRDQLIENKLLTQDMTNWYNDLLEAIPATLCDVSRLNKDIVLSGN